MNWLSKNHKKSECNMARRKTPSIIIAYWDTQDPRNEGWAWRAIWYDDEGYQEHEESGDFDGREDLQAVSVKSRARRAAGFPGTRIPVEIK